jgi:hypothetical protein
VTDDEALRFCHGGRRFDAILRRDSDGDFAAAPA